ncbi:YihY/virulence factor BrkB family protein [Halpernia frigidisoli]|uniref:Membrane protein n=1 Tax=Halpernia frigidisoli TaxID=1125876 RepID=A0A1I3F5B7_9FLAO|nr:YihY/virulence factor BrkB family protein [Halpernia frigidisoli]SFI06397.1 membrane protein [Halpernia frigidisoli]
MGLKSPLFIKKIHGYLDGLHIPFLGISLWKMFEIYGKGIFRIQLGRQAASISWSFFLSLFPLLLFMLSLLPYLPHYDKLQFYVFEVLLRNIFPAHMQTDVSDYIQHSIIPNLKNFGSATIIFALIFATNGAHSLINGFNLNTELKRTFVKEYLVSFVITIAFIGVIMLSLLGIYYSEVVLKLFKPHYNISWFVQNLSKIIGYISFPFLYFILLIFFYWIGCLKITTMRQAIPGAIFTTVLFILITFIFAFYVQKFARQNILYGSVGSMILLMVWINLNIMVVLLGNELNIAIKKVRVEKIMSEEIGSFDDNYNSSRLPDSPQEEENHNIVWKDRT